MFYRIFLIFPLFVLFPLLGSVAVYTPIILAKIDRNPDHFTQGIKFHKGVFYESVGRYGKSQVLRYRISGEKKDEFSIQARYELPYDVFAEDIEIIGEVIYLLTWREERAYTFNHDLEIIQTQPYDEEGWGIAYDGEYLITSDGSSTLIFRDTLSLEKIKSIQVTLESVELKRINALEYVEGQIYANVWYDNHIFIISPQTGEVVGIIDCEPIVIDNYRLAQDRKIYEKFTFSEVKENVLNGIAYDEREKVFYLTGKRWLYFYKVLFKKTKVSY